MIVTLHKTVMAVKIYVHALHTRCTTTVKLYIQSTATTVKLYVPAVMAVTGLTYIRYIQSVQLLSNATFKYCNYCQTTYNL